MHKEVLRKVRAVTGLMDNTHGELRLFGQAHSQGTETAHNLSPHLKKMMEINAFAPARILHKGDFADAKNHINRFDIVPYCDPVGIIKGLAAKNIRYHPTCGGVLADHAYNSPNFKNTRALIGRARMIRSTMRGIK